VRKLLVTGSSGLIGSEVCRYFNQLGWEIHGIDNNQREVFFGISGNTRWNQMLLQQQLNNFHHHELDIRDRQLILNIIAEIKPDAIVHTAAQPSHDKAAAIPFEDFDTNAVGTFNLLEATRRYSTSIPFIHMSTNKVYGDAPNHIPLIEFETRWDYSDEKFANGIPESFPIDHTLHSIFGASKLAADIMVQEYGRYFNMPTVCLRGGCLTGPNHSGVELHGFLSYLIKCNLEQKKYNINGYKGKQVRDNIHAFDVACFINEFINSPKIGAVYNLGGGKSNTCSILEAFGLIENISQLPMQYEYHETSRLGDHICYYSDLSLMQKDYPNWTITKSLEKIFQEIYLEWQKRASL
jgi:CDP-paratose 2-epimerase